ncbi:MAG: ABC transporter substrate-binding protein [Candidatus Bathyarchaeia archaeon]
MSKSGITFRAKVLIIVVIVVIAAIAGTMVYLYYAAPRAGVKEVRVGYIASITGVLAAFGQPHSWAVQKFFSKVTEVTVGGERLQIKLITYDDSSDATKAVALAEQLILQDKVHILLTSAGPPITAIPIAQDCDRYKMPCLTDGLFEPWWESGPYKYAWCIASSLITEPPEGDPRHGKPGYTDLGAYLEFTNLFRDKTNRRVAIFAPDDADGRVFYNFAKDRLPKAGYTIVGVEKNLGLYAPGTMDFTAIIREWKEAGAEILWGLSDSPSFANMWRQANTLGWKPKLAMDGRALKNYDDVAAIGGGLQHGLIDPFNIWNPYLPWKCSVTGITGMQLAEEWTRETGKPWTDILSGYSVGEVTVHVLEAAGSLDSEVINNAFTKVDFISLGWGKVKFVPEWHWNPQQSQVGQWVITEKGELKMEIVHGWTPEVKPTAEVIFPLP